MKNKRNVLSLVLLLVAVLCFGVACKRDVPQKHEISFYIDAEKVTSLQTAGNEVLVLPNAPEKTDYSFDGWYFDEGVWHNKLTENTYKNQALNEDISVYAHYLKNEGPKPVEQFTIEFKVNGKTFSTIETAGNEKLSLPVAPEITGSNFIGWYFDENVWSQRLTETTYLNEKLTENKVVYAYYLKEEQNTYPVTFVTNGGTALESVTVSVLESAPETKREGFTFEGWYLDEEFQNKAQFPLTITQATTLYAKWKENVPQGVEFVVDSTGMITEIKNISPNTELIIPEKVNGVTVKSIANYLLRNNKDIVSVTMPDTLTSVGIETFRNCSNLKKVVFSKGLKSIDPGAFEECVSLTEVNLPENLVEIRSDAFAGSGIVKLDLPDSVKSIWQMAFDGCKNLSVLNLNKVEEISQLAFRNCTSLRAVVIPDTVVSLAEYNIFYGCTALAEIKMPDKAIPVSYCTFENTAYADKSLYPSHYENGAFYVDNFLICMDKDFTGSSVTVREGTIVVADSAFYCYGGGGRGCENIVSVSLPEGLKRIGRNSFNGCEKLASLNIPSSVESIGERAFESTKLGVWKDNGLYLDNWLVSVKDTSMNKFTVADGTVGIADSDNALFKTSAGDVKEILLPSTLKYIGTCAFKNTGIAEIVFPAGLISIGKQAFLYCSNLAKVNLGECTALKSIGEAAFSRCNFEEVNIPSSVEYMGRIIFNGNQKDMTVNCAFSEKPQGWNAEWASNVSFEPKQIIVNWLG